MRQDSCITGTGVLLLFAWLLVFVNVIMNKPDQKMSSWRKRIDPYQMKEETPNLNQNMMLVLSTSLMPTEVEFFVTALIFRTNMDLLQKYNATLFTFCQQC